MLKEIDPALRSAASTVKCAYGTECWQLSQEACMESKLMTALIRRTGLPEASRGAVERATRALGVEGVTRAKTIRTTIPFKDGVRAGGVLNRDFTAPRPDHTWAMDFTYVRSWAGWVYVASNVDVYSQGIAAWHTHTSKHVGLVMIPIRMVLWERERQGRSVQPNSCERIPMSGPKAPRLLTPRSSPWTGLPR
ncbi:hypothetical protein GCM10027591_04620 [Zhihengliuella somnathii]